MVSFNVPRSARKDNGTLCPLRPPPAGQLVGSLVAATVVRAPLLRSGSPSSPSLLPLLISAGMLAAAGEFAVRFRAQGPATGRPTAGRDDQAEEGLRLDVGVQTGPTLGGRPSARGISWRQTLSSTAEGFRLIRQVGVHCRASARCCAGPVMGAHQLRTQATGWHDVWPWKGFAGKAAALTDPAFTNSANAARMLHLHRHSPYLRHLCLFLVFNYIISSFFYFEKSLVAATSVSDAGGLPACTHQ